MSASLFDRPKSLARRVAEAMNLHVVRLDRAPRGYDWLRDLNKFVGIGDGHFFDVGAHTGQTAHGILRRVPAARIDAFEPVPQTYRALVEATRSCPSVRCHNLAIGAEASTLTVHVIPENQRNSLVGSGFEGHPEAVACEVEVRTVDDVMQEHAIDRLRVLKTDTEGYDLAVLQGAENAVRERRIDAIVSEVGGKPRYAQHTSMRGVLDWADAHDFYVAGFYEQDNLLRPSSPDSYCNIMLVGAWLLSERQRSRGVLA